MNLTRLYRALLRLYPSDYRKMFAEEMIRTFQTGAGELLKKGRLVRARWVLAEFLGVLIGAAAEWASKLRPRAPEEPSFAEAPDNLPEAERRVSLLVDAMVHAIANHDFPKARSCSYQEQVAREHLRRLKES